MNVLVILNDPPYGTERSWNGLRLAGSLARRDAVDEEMLTKGARRSSLEELADWTLWAAAGEDARGRAVSGDLGDEQPRGVHDGGPQGVRLIRTTANASGA